jgi:glycosyltransferase involved in cell wall biosynthesis
VVDDGSSDNTSDILQEYFQDKRVKFFRFEENKGKVAAFNKAYKESTGNVITLLAADDVMLSGRDQLSRLHISTDQPLFWIGNYIKTDEHLNFISRKTTKKVGWPKILEQNFYPGGAIAFNRCFGEKIFPLNTKLPSEDYFIALVACYLGCEVSLDKDFLAYRRHSANTWGDVPLHERIAGTSKRNIIILEEFINYVIRNKLVANNKNLAEINSAIKYERAQSAECSLKDKFVLFGLPKCFSLKARIRVLLGARLYSLLIKLIK